MLRDDKLSSINNFRDVPGQATLGPRVPTRWPSGRFKKSPANLAILLMTEAVSPEALLRWGWRTPFLLSVFLVAIGVYVQGRLEETPE